MKQGPETVFTIFRMRLLKDRRRDEERARSTFPLLWIPGKLGRGYLQSGMFSVPLSYPPASCPASSTECVCSKYVRPSGLGVAGGEENGERGLKSLRFG